MYALSRSTLYEVYFAEKYVDSTTGKVSFKNEAILIVGRK